MLVQDYLRSGKTLDDLQQELGIKNTVHPELPLVIVNYCQIDSPKTHPIVRECRGLTLDTRDWSIVARSFPRFFNWGEVQDEMGNFDFSDFCVQTKEDGSLVILYNFEGKWMANTRGSFAQDNMQGTELTWTEGFCKAMGVPSLAAIPDYLNPDMTFVLEFCSPWNKVVRRYAEPTMYLLTAFEGEREVPFREIDGMNIPLFRTVQRHDFSSIEDIQDFLHRMGSEDPTFEGVVIRDCNNNRWKIKNATYLGLHKLRGEGDNLFNPKHLLPFVLAGEEDELLTYYNEVSETYYKTKIKVLEAYITLVETWGDHRHVPEQKDFAQAILGKTPFTGILFTLRKNLGLTDQKASDLRRAWRDAESAIIKHVFGR